MTSHMISENTVLSSSQVQNDFDLWQKNNELDNLNMIWPLWQLYQTAASRLYKHQTAKYGTILPR